VLPVDSETYPPFFFILLNKLDAGKWDTSLQLYCEECFESKREEKREEGKKIKKTTTRLFCLLKQRRLKDEEKGKLSVGLFEEFINEALKKRGTTVYINGPYLIFFFV
jgi:hypothetical protein